MDIAKDLKKAIRRINKGRDKSLPPVYLSISPFLSTSHLFDDKLVSLMEIFLRNVLLISHPAKAIRVAAHRVPTMTDLEKFFSVAPSSWLHLSVESEAETGFVNAAKEVLKDIGFSCFEWIGLEDSESQLGAFSFGASDKLSLALFNQDRGARRHCDFLIPVAASDPCYAMIGHCEIQSCLNPC